MIYPLPAKMRVDGVCPVSGDSVWVFGDESEYAAEFFLHSGIAVCENSSVRIALKRLNTRELTFIEQSRCLSREKFNIKTARCGDIINVTVEFAYKNGLFYALNRLSRAIGGELVLGEIEDYPLFKRRGFIEGFYGKPWSIEHRAEMINLLSSYGMNSYFYAPKDDPYHRSRWQELYPDSQLRQLKRLVDLCGEVFVDFTYCIAPGLSVCYSSEEDYQALLCKVNQLYSIGVRSFGLLFDDIPEKLHYEQDIKAFDYESVNAHIYYTNRFYDDLKKLDGNCRLTVCPTVYHGNGDEYYISKLGQGIEPDIDLFWTGKNICSQELTVPQACTFIGAANHRPLYWDNYPVNDAEMYNEMHLGFICGRAADLYRYSEGIIANTMEYALSSRIPLLTVADYLWNPLAYEPRQSWQTALSLLLDGDEGCFELFADNLFASCLKCENSSVFNAVVAKVQQRYYDGDFEGALSELSAYLDSLGECCLMLEADKPLFNELRPWIKKQQLAYRLLRECESVLKGAGDKSRAAELLAEYLAAPQVLYDFSLQSFAQEVISLG